MRRDELLRAHQEKVARQMGASDTGGPGTTRRMPWRGCLVGGAGVALALILVGALAFCSAMRQESGLAGSGTGFFVSSSGLLVTATHVVEGASGVWVAVNDEVWPAKVLKLDSANDVAILKVEVPVPVPFLPLADSAAIRMGTDVFTVGFPNIQIQGVSPKLTRGEVSSLTGMQDDPRFFQISVPVQPGNSGGPLLNLHGRVVGIVVSRLDDRFTLFASGALPQNVNYAIKSSYVRALLDDVPDAERGRTAARVEPAANFDQAMERAEAAVALVLVEFEGK
jgi:S1-C subfamily serine protease